MQFTSRQRVFSTTDDSSDESANRNAKLLSSGGGEVPFEAAKRAGDFKHSVTRSLSK